MVLERKSVENLITEPRVQLFSYDKEKGMAAGHKQLNSMSNQYPDLKSYTAILVIEKNSQWIHAQIGPFTSKVDADNYAKNLDEIFPKDKPCPVAANIVHQANKEFEQGEIHNWE